MKKAVRIDLTDQRFGKLTVLYPGSKAANGSLKWFCKCDCGKIIETRGDRLRSGETQSCGCAQKEKYDLTGQKINMLFIAERIGSNKHKQSLYRCYCDCGKEKIISASDLKSGRVISCGCHAKSFLDELHENNKIHGLSNSRIYRVWDSMMQRCYNNKSKAFKYYGGRGIIVCSEWHKVENFAKWAYENGYDENAKQWDCTIDRINVNGNYEPSNCRWVDMKTQNQNKRNSKKHT